MSGAGLDGDGRVDILVTEENGRGATYALARWWEQPEAVATKADWPRHTIATRYTMKCLDGADTDKDGDIDLVLADHRGARRIPAWESVSVR